jgi:hypothetical protein
VALLALYLQARPSDRPGKNKRNGQSPENHGREINMIIRYNNIISLVIYLFTPFAYFAFCLIKLLPIRLISVFLIFNFAFNAKFNDICHQLTTAFIIPKYPRSRQAVKRR